MIVGIFHPTLNVCGGAEWVAANIIDVLKNENHKVVVLANSAIDQTRIRRFLGRPVASDVQIIFPFEIFPSMDLHNVYTDALRALLLKTQCDIVIDTYSNAMLPGVDITYIHFPLFGRLRTQLGRELKNKTVTGFKDTYFLPYSFYEKAQARIGKRLIIANSKYTANAIKKITGVKPALLYPPIPETFFVDCDRLSDREDIVVSVSRISPEKLLTTIPSIARLTNKKIRFLIIGIKQSSLVLNDILELIQKNEVSDRVNVITDLSREKLRKTLRTAKVFLHPAHGEHFGVSIAEAMASGCIPIVHNSGGPVEFIPHRFRFNDLGEAARKIDKALFEWSPQQAEQLVRAARSFSEGNFREDFSDMFNSYVCRRWRA